MQYLVTFTNLNKNKSGAVGCLTAVDIAQTCRIRAGLDATISPIVSSAWLALF